MSDLARDLVAHPRFARAAGMRLLRPDGGFPIRIVDIDPRIATHEGSGGDFATGWWDSDVVDLADPATAGVLLVELIAAARARFLVVEVESDWRTKHPEVRLVELHGGGRTVLAAFVEMSLGEAIARALLAIWNATEASK